MDWWSWSVAGLVLDIIGVAAIGADPYIWTKASPINLFPNLPAPTRFGFDVPRSWWRYRMWVYWALILIGFVLQVVGQFR
jgi:hypothetical protein